MSAHEIIKGVFDRPIPLRLDGETVRAHGWGRFDGALDLGLGEAVAIGGYNEWRGIYESDAFTGGDEPRTVHLGLDIFAPAGTEVFAPHHGMVHSFADNSRPQDYGPTIVLQHGDIFALYGHLSRESLLGLSEGKIFRAGDRIGWLGAPEVNGDWPPHLHFQLIRDMMGFKGDFIGACKASERDKWLYHCPDPHEFLGITPP